MVVFGCFLLGRWVSMIVERCAARSLSGGPVRGTLVEGRYDLDDAGSSKKQTRVHTAARQEDSWQLCTVAGFRAANFGQRMEAAGYWFEATQFTAEFARADPRRATAAHNAAVASLIEQRYENALGYFSTARDLWLAAPSWIEAIDIPLAGRGSIFHFQLASKHCDALVIARRQRYVTLCRGAASITNLLTQLTQSWMRVAAFNDTSFDTALSALGAAFGEACPEFQLMSQVRNGSGPFQIVPNQSLFDRWERDAAQPHDQSRELFAAIYLTAGLHPTHLPWSPGLRCFTSEG